MGEEERADSKTSGAPASATVMFNQEATSGLSSRQRDAE